MITLSSHTYRNCPSMLLNLNTHYYQHPKCFLWVLSHVWALCQPATDNKGHEISICEYIYMCILHENSPALWEIDAECGPSKKQAYVSCGVRTAQHTVMYGVLWWGGISPGTPSRAGCWLQSPCRQRFAKGLSLGGDPLTGQLPKTWGTYRKTYVSDYKKKSPRLLAALFPSPSATMAAIPPPWSGLAHPTAALRDQASLWHAEAALRHARQDPWALGCNEHPHPSSKRKSSSVKDRIKIHLWTIISVAQPWL